MKKDEATKDGKTLISYYLMVVGLPKDKVYYLWQKTLSNSTPTQILADTRTDDAGHVITRTVRVSVGAYGYAKGEAMEVALMTQDKTTGAFGKIIPYPIESKQGSYRMWVELRSPKRDIFMVWGEGFEPNEEIDTTSTSDGEVVKSKKKVDSKGRFTTIILPAVVGKESGLATYTALGKSGEVKVSYEWGPPALRSGP